MTTLKSKELKNQEINCRGYLKECQGNPKQGALCWLKIKKDNEGN